MQSLVLHFISLDDHAIFDASRAICSSHTCWCYDELRTEHHTSRIHALKSGPHRFGGEGVLIGGQTATLNASITFVNIAVAISALAGGAKNGFAPRPEFGGVSDIFRGFLGV